jgi:hypothetical protein
MSEQLREPHVQKENNIDVTNKLKKFNTVFDEFHLVTETSSAATKLKFIKKSVDISPTNI